MRLRSRYRKILVPDALVLVPTNELYIMVHAFRSFLALARDLVGSIFDSPVRTPKPTIHYPTFKFTCYLYLDLNFFMY